MQFVSMWGRAVSPQNKTMVKFALARCKAPRDRTAVALTRENPILFCLPTLFSVL